LRVSINWAFVPYFTSVDGLFAASRSLVLVSVGAFGANLNVGEGEESFLADRVLEVCTLFFKSGTFKVETVDVNTFTWLRNVLSFESSIRYEE